MADSSPSDTDSKPICVGREVCPTVLKASSSKGPDLKTWSMLLAMIVMVAGLVTGILSTVYYTQSEAGVHVQEYTKHTGAFNAHVTEYRAATDILKEMRGEMKEQRKLQRTTTENLIRIGERLRVRHLRRPEPDRSDSP